MEIKLICQGSCGEKGKTLYPVKIKDPGTGETKEKMYCTDCFDDHILEVKKIERISIQQEQIELNEEMSNVPKIFKGKTFDDFVIDPMRLAGVFNEKEMTSIRGAEDIVRKFLDAINSGESAMLALIGDYGTGKSLLASICVNEIIKKGGLAKFEHAGIFLRRLMDNFTYEEIILSLTQNDLTVIDDITSANVSVFTEKSLSDIIDAIYSAGKSLIVTANGTGKELQKYTGERGYDRIQESPFGGIVPFRWRSVRGTPVQSK